MSKLLCKVLQEEAFSRRKQIEREFAGRQKKIRARFDEQEGAKVVTVNVALSNSNEVFMSKLLHL